MNKKYIVMGILIIAFVAASFWLIPSIINDNNYPYLGHMSSGWMPLGMILMGSFWLLVIYFIVQTVRLNNEQHDHAIAVLKARLAKGEISIEEYETLYKKLKEI